MTARPPSRQPSFGQAIVCAVAILTVLAGPAARADMQELMDEQFTALTNVTEPASFQTSRRGVLSGGGAYARVPIMNDRLVSLVPPSFEAGCGGIDFFSGSFSFINADQFVALMKATAANAAGYAFQVAMSAMCETCMAAIETLQKKIQELNQYFGNSCQLAQGIVNDTAAAMGVQRTSKASVINSAAGIADVFGAWTNDTDGQSPEPKAAEGAPDDYAEQVQGNLVWRELQKRGVSGWFLGGDNALLEVAMNITGTVIVGKLADTDHDDQAPELSRIMPRPDLFRFLVEGGEVTIRGCGDGYDADKCLVLVDKTVTITGFQERIRNLLLGDGIDQGIITLIYQNAAAMNDAQKSLLHVMPNSVGGLLYRLAQLKEPAGQTFAAQAAPVMAFVMAAEICRKLLYATSAAVALADNPYIPDVQQMMRDANSGLQASVAEMQSRYGSLAELVRQYYELLLVINPAAAQVTSVTELSPGGS